MGVFLERSRAPKGRGSTALSCLSRGERQKGRGRRLVRGGGGVCGVKKNYGGPPWWSSGWNLPCRAGDVHSVSGLGTKVPRARGHEAVNHNCTLCPPELAPHAREATQGELEEARLRRREPSTDPERKRNRDQAASQEGGGLGSRNPTC